MHGFTYMQFISPGLIMMAVITNAYANVAFILFSAKFQRKLKSCWWRQYDACDYCQLRRRVAREDCA